MNMTVVMVCGYVFALVAFAVLVTALLIFWAERSSRRRVERWFAKHAAGRVDLYERKAKR